jgi:polyhydroxyalkanoate synthesis regulator phasin
MANSKLIASNKRQLASKNHIEASSIGLGDLPSAFAKDIKQNIQNTPSDIFDQLLGIRSYETNATLPKSGDMQMGEAIDLKAHKPKVEHKPVSEKREHAAPAMDYHKEIVRQSERSSSKESSELKQQIQQIQAELARLVSSADKIVQATYGEYQVNTAPKIGKYHINFLSWMVLVIQDARRKVEDSGAWLSAAKGKGGKKDYWSQYKSKGTSFGMSNERSVATQTG